MNALLTRRQEEVIQGKATDNQRDKLNKAIIEIRNIFPDWDDEKTKALFRLAALYHDIGKYIIRERHPTIGWHIVQHIAPDQRDALKRLLEREDYFELLMILIRDHDQFGVLSTGEASYPILPRTAGSMGEALDDQKRLISALMLCNLADMAGTFKVDGDTIDTLIGDWHWILKALTDCSENKLRFDDYVIEEASKIPNVCERIRRLLVESSRNCPVRRNELNDRRFVRSGLYTVFGTENSVQEFASQFTHVCKLDYGKRFFEALMEYSEGSSKANGESARMDRKDVLYAVLAILKRITMTYAAMVRSDIGPGNLIGVELKDLTPKGVPEKTARIIELIITSHFPGLTWMMSDVPAWYF